MESATVVDNSFVDDFEPKGCFSWLRKLRRSRLSVAAVVAFALFIDMIVYGVVVPILPEYASNSIGASDTEIGFLFACYALGLLVFTPIFGIVSDKWGRKYPMLAGLAALGGGTVLFAFANTYAMLVLARMAQGAAAASTWVIGLAMLADIYPADELGTVMGVMSGANSLGMLLGPILGGFLFEMIGYKLPFFICAGLAAFDLILRIVIISDEALVYHAQRVKDLQKAQAKSHGETEQKPPTIWQLARHPPVIATCLAVVMASGLFSGIEPTLPIYLELKYKATSSTIGLMFVAVLIPYLCAASIVGWLADKYGRKSIIGFGHFMFAGAAPLMALPNTIALQTVTHCAFGLGAAVMISPTMPEMAVFVDQLGGGSYGQVYAIYNLAYSIGMLFGPALAGVLMEHVGFFWLLVALAGAILVYSPVYLLYDLRRIHEKYVPLPDPEK